MNTAIINPWTWQDQLGYAQAVEVTQHSSTLYCAGQAAIDAEGRPVAGSMGEQMNLCLQNLGTVIAQAGYNASNIVRLNFYTTSIPDFFADYGVAVGWMKANGVVPSSTLTEVSALAYPELKIEIEATVVR